MSTVQFVPEGIGADLVADIALERDLDEFFALDSFDAARTREFLRAGFLPMSMAVGDGHGRAVCILPKLHRTRAILDWEDLHVGRSVRRAARDYVLGVDVDFEKTLHACAARHGEDWLTPELQAHFIHLCAEGPRGGVSFHSFELFRAGDVDRASTAAAPVAGEIGYVCGSCYTSLSGYRLENSAGSVQMAATASVLRASGAACWDLGMPIPYKEALGARGVPRGEFLARWRKSREGARPDFPRGMRGPARDLVAALR